MVLEICRKLKCDTFLYYSFIPGHLVWFGWSRSQGVSWQTQDGRNETSWIDSGGDDDDPDQDDHHNDDQEHEEEAADDTEEEKEEEEEEEEHLFRDSDGKADPNSSDEEEEEEAQVGSQSNPSGSHQGLDWIDPHGLIPLGLPPAIELEDDLDTFVAPLVQVEGSSIGGPMVSGSNTNAHPDVLSPMALNVVTVVRPEDEGEVRFFMHVYRNCYGNRWENEMEFYRKLTCYFVSSTEPDPFKGPDFGWMRHHAWWERGSRL